MIEYIVGIDFGHGETAAWVVPISEDNNAQIKLEGQSLRLRESNDMEAQKIPSVVYYDASGKHYLSNSGKSGIAVGMKGLIATMEQGEKAHYQEFIRLILERLLDLNKDIIKIIDGESNFLLCMASPTKWNEEEKRDYLNFFNNAISPLNLRFEWIINESDAAYFTHCDNGSVDDRCSLVIDYGSSTIDYTAIRNGRKISNDKWSNRQIGASTIEKIMFRTLEIPKDSTADEMIGSTKSLLHAKALDFIDPYQILIFSLRKEKEICYTDKAYYYDFSYKFTKATYDPDFTNYIYNFSGDLTELTEEYRKVVENDLKGLREKLLAINNGKDPDRIILSGGASIMRWFKDLVREIFSCDDVKDDAHPSFVVAKGIALYARAQKKAISELKEKIESLDYSQLYTLAVRRSKFSLFKLLSPDLLKEISSKEIENGEQLQEIFLNLLKGFNPDNRFANEYMQATFNQLISEYIWEKVIETLHSIFNCEIKSNRSILHIPVIISYSKPETYLPGGAWYEKISDGMANGISVPQRWFNLTKKRTKDEIMKMYHGVINYLDDLSQWNLEIDGLNELIPDLKEVAVSIAIKIFHEEELFKTTFVQN